VDGRRPLAGDLLRLLTARAGHFRLESGHHGNLWLDLDQLFVRPKRLAPFTTDLAGRLAPHGVEVVCGPLLGGAFVAQAVAALSDMDCCWTERHSGQSTVEYVLPPALAPVVRGRRVAVLDDVVSAGSAVSGTVQAVRVAGGIPVAVGALLVLGGSADRLGAAERMAVEYVAHRPNPLWSPVACPLCAAGEPLRDLVR
jgi:orotate phosphoribosyltransferase